MANKKARGFAASGFGIHVVEMRGFEPLTP